MPDETASPKEAPRIDGFEITSRLGEGGMGAVWRGVQLNTKREVAIKTISGHKLDSESARLRFQREIELAARLEHPNIAQIYESGVSDGVYYYALQLVDGIRFTQYAAALDDRERLVLMRKTAEALNYAHQKGVIHRDLKPDNILVSADGEPHLLDFGLAKEIFTEPAPAEPGQPLTMEGTVAGTPAYMAPEQARGDLAAMDVRTDVFALGVMLYEMLTGKVPFPYTDGLYEWMQRLMKEDVVRPRQIRSTIDPEVEAILLRTLEKDPEHRYGSAAALAEDIGRYLNGDPVMAQTHTWSYLLKKRVVKYRVPLSIAAVLVLLSIAGTIQYIVSLDREKARAQSAEMLALKNLREAEDARTRATAARELAEQAQHQAEEVSDFLMEALQSPHPERAGKSITVADTLDRARQWLDQTYSGSPQSRARLLWAIGKSYNGLGLYKKAEAAFTPALEVYREALGPRHLNTRLVQQGLALSLQSQGRLEEAQALYRVLLKQTDTATESSRIDALHNMAGIYMQQQRFAEAEPLLQEVLAARLETFGSEALETLKVQSNLAVVDRRLGRPQAALDRYQSILGAAGKTLGMNHPVTINAGGGAALALFALGQHQAALERINETLILQQQILGREHPNTLSTLHNRARIQRALGDVESALRDYASAYSQRARVLGKASPETIASALGLAASYEKLGQVNEAISVYQEFPDHPGALEGLAFLYFARDDFSSSEKCFRSLYALHHRQRGAADPLAVDTLRNLALVLEKQGRNEEARKTREEISAVQP